MANDGGVLLIGVGEDENRRPATLEPFPLAGVRERVDQIARSGIHEPPVVRCHPIKSASDENTGYLAIEIPPSPRAPHIVQIQSHNRFHGRSSARNVPLVQGEVERLYARRRDYEQDQSDLLDKVIAAAPVEPHSDLAYLHLVAQPVITDCQLLRAVLRDAPAGDDRRRLQELVASARDIPDFESTPYWIDGNFRQTLNGWILQSPEEIDDANPKHTRVLELRHSGTYRFFTARAGARSNSTIFLFEDQIANWTARFLFLIGIICLKANYRGPVDIAVALTGIEGAMSHHLAQNRFTSHTVVPISQEDYSRTTRALAPELETEPSSTAEILLADLFAGLTQGSYNPFRRVEE